MTAIHSIAALAFAVLLPATAQAAPRCAERAVLLDEIWRAEDKVIVARAVTGAGDLYEIAANARGEMSVVMTFPAGISIRADGGVYRYPPGTACVAGEGQGWQLVPDSPGRAA